MDARRARKSAKGGYSILRQTRVRRRSSSLKNGRTAQKNEGKLQKWSAEVIVSYMRTPRTGSASDIQARRFANKIFRSLQQARNTCIISNACIPLAIAFDIANPNVHASIAFHAAIASKLDFACQSVAISLLCSAPPAWA